MAAKWAQVSERGTNRFSTTTASGSAIANAIAPAANSSKDSLILGNTAILKPASDTPLVAAKFVEILVEAGLPAGVLNFITGSGGALGKILCTHPKVGLVSFTGSTEVGKGINAMCAPSLKRVSMEMGGKNAILVMADADLDLAVDGIVWSAFGTSGQRCTAASRVIVERPVYAAVTAKLVARAKRLRLGNGLDPKSEVGPVINRSHLQKIHEYTQIALKEDRAKLLCGGKIEDRGPLARGSFYPPTIFGDVRAGVVAADDVRVIVVEDRYDANCKLVVAENDVSTLAVWHAFSCCYFCYPYVGISQRSKGTIKDNRLRTVAEARVEQQQNQRYF